MKILVIGASGTIGKALVKLLQQDGHEVIESSRNSQLPVDIENWNSIENLYRKVGPFDSIICTAGGVAFGNVEGLSETDFNYSATSKMLGQVGVTKLALPYLNPNGSIILSGGMLAYKPWPGTSAVAMVNAAVEGFVKAAAKELSEGRRILVVHPPHVAETAASKGMDTSNCPSASEVAATYIDAMKSQKNGEPVFVGKFVP